MEDNRTKFEFTCVDEHTPLVTDPFFEWLNQNRDRKENKGDIALIQEYLRPKGYDPEKHFLDENQFKILKYVSELWHRNTPWFRETYKFSDLFIKADKKSDSTYFIWEYYAHYQISEKLKEMMNEVGMIYHLSPKNYYFRTENNRLVVQYQFIIGSRYLCNLEEK